ncbi:DUF2948 family protein [Allosediminivita pacifica]|uniref:DUF2948 family protein n=1 Tax=Allosediminivita pacifica TaxID=1267769 RepID=A0A2T6B9N9_9RHOB|nr:DUF2948 family protein [Allosediminivita pacifica]PTX52779.1 hypothetical protein C8N44_10169 [Allosediminivita pacifica]GGA95881.1 hypothetical protein GCM10011324_02750 [Allosediminivita pacifica]
MTEDARFEDGGEKPLYLGALDPDDLQVISALVQDAVLQVSEIRWQAGQRRLALLVNRLRREASVAEPQAPERVRALMVVDNVLRVASQGIDRSDPDLVLSILSVGFEPGEDGTGAVVFTLAGDGAIKAEVEALDVVLRDVTRPYLAPSGKVPVHPED